MNRFTISMVILTTTASAAAALDQMQLTALRNVGQASTAAALCHYIEIDEDLLTAHLAGRKLDLNDPDQRAIMETASASARESFDTWPENAVCSEAMIRFGPGGTGVLRWKQ